MQHLKQIMKTILSPIINHVVLSLLFLLWMNYTEAQPSNWTIKGVGGGGAVYRPSISPHNGNKAFLACDMTPIHQTNDFGKTWSLLPFQQLPGNRNTEVQFTSVPTKLFALKKPGSPYLPAKSYDGGQSWISCTNPCTSTASQYFANPFDTDQVVISHINKIYFTNNENAGTYSTVLTYSLSTTGHLAGVFFENKDTLYVCTHDTLLYTFNGGLSWFGAVAGTQGIPANESIVSFKGAKQGGRWVFYAITILANPSFKISQTFSSGFSSYKGLYKLGQNQSQWTSLNANLPSPTDKLYLLGLSDHDTATLYAAGSSNSVGVNLGAIFRSTNGGSNFTNVFLNSAMFSTNANIRTGWFAKHSGTNAIFNWNGLNYICGLDVDPNNPSRIMCCDGMTVHTSTDMGNNWEQAYTDTTYQNAPSTLLSQAQSYKSSGLETTVSYWLTWLGSNNIFACYNDIMARKSANGGSTWNCNITGLDSTYIHDVNMTILHPLNGKLYAASGEVPGSNGDYSDVRAAMAKGRISVSSDSGSTWVTLKSFGRAVSYIAFDPKTSYGMYATVMDTLGGIGGIYYCPNVIATPSSWNRLNQPNRTEGRPLQILPLKNGDLVAVYGTRDTSKSNTPSYFFSQSSGVFLSKNGGISWADSNLSVMMKSVSTVEIDRNDTSENTWLAFVGSNGSTGGVFRTTNKGASWFQVHNQASVSGTFHPVQANTLYIATEVNGLLYATNTNSNSFSISTVNSYPFRRPQKVFFNPYNNNEVWVTSFGNGTRMGMATFLPVQMRYFHAVCNGQQVNLKWSTASETNNAFFVVEKSSDMKNWDSTGTIKGHGNSLTTNNYEYTVQLNPSSNRYSYFRLVQTNFDGNKEYFPANHVSCSENDEDIVIFPNPAQYTVSFSTVLNGAELMNLQGTVVIHVNGPIQQLDLTGLAPGLYLLKSGTHTARIILQP